MKNYLVTMTFELSAATHKNAVDMAEAIAKNSPIEEANYLTTKIKTIDYCPFGKPWETIHGDEQFKVEQIKNGKL